MIARTYQAAFCFLLLPAIAYAENWPQWRGPTNNGISTEKGIATKWSQTEHVKWSTPMPGPAGATPVVWNDRLFVTSADGRTEGVDLLLICIGTADGKEIWRRTVVAGGSRFARSPAEGNWASASPSTDGKNVWVSFGSGILACYDIDGKEIWKFNLEERFGKIDMQFGFHSTPVLRGDHLYLQLIHGELPASSNVRTGKVVKLNKLTGATVWEVDRITYAKQECKQSYASAFIYDDGKTSFLVAHGADCTTGHSLDDGKELWRVAGVNGPAIYNSNRFDPTFRYVASPVMANGSIIVPSAKKGPMLSLRVSDALKGNVTGNAQAVRWVASKTPDVSIPLVVDGLVYCVQDPGELQSFDLETGKEVDNISRMHAFAHRSSPIYADGHIYICAKDGVCTVVKAGPKMEIVAKNELGSPISACPVISNGTLYIRTWDALYAIR